jgi:hypothetical protein
MFVALTLSDYSRHPDLSFSIATPLPTNRLPPCFLTTSIIKILNAFQKEKVASTFSTAIPSKPYFCLDTSLNRTLAYRQWCNWGNVLESFSIRSHSRFAGETGSSVNATTFRRVLPSYKRTDPAHPVGSIAGGSSFSQPLQKQSPWPCSRREAVRQNTFLHI